MIVRLTSRNTTDTYYIQCYVCNRLRNWDNYYATWNKILKGHKIEIEAEIVKEKLIELIKSDYKEFMKQNIGNNELKYTFDIDVELRSTVTEKDEGNMVVYYFGRTGNMITQ